MNQMKRRLVIGFMLTVLGIAAVTATFDGEKQTADAPITGFSIIHPPR
ncbi:hypothetical protein [Sporolactobacillus spathodeae]|uniref:Uncharacterized protein n=1 Tax=Sporolactobacillus spathodeae TaxID=1465502 RepID=A0ABS2Q9S9_9BACL|nr:hypothetical protein [Sporolactobacillus spathodeae]MBM7658537.1 hypothetical protein [Sporolactobacillus spathodeae]